MFEHRFVFVDKKQNDANIIHKENVLRKHFPCVLTHIYVQKEVRSVKKVVCIILTMFIVGVSVSSCGSNSGQEEETSKESTVAGEAGSSEDQSWEGKKLVISTYLADASQVEVREKYIDGPLAEAFPGADIEIKMYNDRQSLQTEVAGGGGPDVLDLDGPTDVVEFAKADRVLPLDSYAEKYGWADIFYDWAYDSCFFQKKLYSLPTSFEGMMIYYNMDVMEENGWEIATTVDELETLMKAMQEKGIIPMSFGNSNYQGAVDWLYSSFLSCNAGPENLKKAIEGDIPFDDPSMVEAINQMVDWWQAGYIGDRASQSITQEDLSAFFAEGRAGMMLNGTWASSQLLTVYPDCNWQAEMIPELREGVGQILPFATGGGYAINANSADPDFAAEVLNYLFTSLDRHYSSIIEATYQPYPLAEFDLERIKDMDPKLFSMYEILDEAQENEQIGYCSWTFFPSQARVYMNENTDAVFLGSLSVEDYLKKTQEYIDDAIEAGETPVIP